MKCPPQASKMTFIALALALLLAHLAPIMGSAQTPRPFVYFTTQTSTVNESAGEVMIRLTFLDGDGTVYTHAANRGHGVRVADGSAIGSTNQSGNPDDGTVDYTIQSRLFTNVVTASSGSFIRIPIIDDGSNEGNETLTISLADSPDSTYAGSFRLAGGALTHTVTIVDDDPPGVTLTPTVVDEDAGMVEFTLALDGIALPGRTPRFQWYTTNHPSLAAGDTAAPGEDYVEVPQSLGNERDVASGESSTATFLVTILDDDEVEGQETFSIIVSAPATEQISGNPSIAMLRQRITIRDNDQPEGPDPILGEISNHLLAQSEALLTTQPRLTDYVRNTGIGASDFALRFSEGGLEMLDGSVAGEGFWGEATFSRSGSRGSDGAHAVASLGTHRQISGQMFLGGMLQFDRTVTKLDGGGRSGEFVGEGWMAGPYFVARDPSRTLFFEGRLLYGQASHDADAIVADTERPGYPRDGSFDSERWILQARVEGEYPLGDGTIMYPLADLSHARNAGNGFDETNRENPGREMDLDVAIRTAVSKLQLGAEFEIPLDPAKGDLLLRTGLKLELSDRKGVAFGKSDLSSSGRIDLGIEYRLEEDVSLGFQGHYSGIGGGSGFENYGAGLRLRMEF